MSGSRRIAVLSAHGEERSRGDFRVRPLRVIPYALAAAGGWTLAVMGLMFWSATDSGWDYARVTCLGYGVLWLTGIVGLSAAARSISRRIREHLRAEASLAHSEAKYRDLFESANDVILAVDSKGYILDINSRGAELIGYARSELIGSNMFELLIHSDHHEQMQAVLDDSAAGDDHVHDLDLLTKAGEIIHFEGSSSARMSPAGEFICTRCILRDITTRKASEEKAKRTLAELEDFNRLAVGRELRMIELKREVNELARKAGIAPPYDLDFTEAFDRSDADG